MPRKTGPTSSSSMWPHTSGEILAFSDANATWARDALRKLVRAFADPDVAYVCGRLVLQDAEGTNREGVYWRFETWLRQQESALGSITGGNGAIYAVRREDYPEVDSRFGHDLSLPYRSEEHTSELQSRTLISYAVFCLKKKKL